jgi:hypothetical protein
LFASGCANGCEHRELLTMPAKATLSGRYCTSSSSQHGVPLRIMAIVDTSKSMEQTDPNDGRVGAAAQLVSAFSGDANVSFAFITFDDDAVPATIDMGSEGVFTRDPAVLQTALDALTRKEGFTNYLAALNAGTYIIQRDIVKTAEELRVLEEMGQNTDLLRPYYFIIFLSDGIPRVRGGVVLSDDAILFAVRELLDVPAPALGATLHTAFLGAQDGEAAIVRLQAESLLQRMAEEGKGLFHNFENGDAIDFTLFNFDILRRHDLKQFVVYNRNVAPQEGDFVLADSDADGVSDEHELSLGADPLDEDTDDDGFRDGFEVAVALDPTRRDPYCVSEPELDTDSDWLRDCEERYLNFDAELFDSDGDLFADHLEQYSGSNPADGRDTEEDLDFDDRITEIELRERTNPNVKENEAQYRQYAYQIEHRKVLDGEMMGKNCFEFTVSNVGLVSTEALGARAAGINELVVEVVEAPEDDPENTSSLLRHVFQASFNDLPSFSDPVAIELGELEFEVVGQQTRERQ